MRFGEGRAVGLGRTRGWLIGGRPERAVTDVAQIAEHAPAVTRGIGAPARDGEVAPAAVTAAGLCQHEMVAAVREQLHLGAGGVWILEDANGGFASRLLGRAARHLGEL